MKIPKLFINNNDKSSSSGQFPSMVLGGGALGFLLALPSGIFAWFDGLPWTGETETLVLAVIIPFLLILRWRFLSFRFSILFLCALLLLKFILFFGSPSSGLLVKIHPNLSLENLKSFQSFKTVEGDSWVKTYASSWNKNVSAIIQSPWNEKLDFPMDWYLLANNDCEQISQVPANCFDILNPEIEIKGALLVPKGKKFALIAKGVQEGTLTAINELGNGFVLTPVESFKDAVQKQYYLPEDGRWKISGKLKYAGSDWSFVPVLIGNDGKTTTDLGREVLWQNDDDLSSSLSRIELYKHLSLVVDGGIIIFLMLWIFSTANYMIQRQVLNAPLFIASILAVSTSYVMAPFFSNALEFVGLWDPTRLSYLGIVILITGIGFLFCTQLKKDHRNFQADRIIPSVFLLFAPSLLFYTSNKWWFSLGQMREWGVGNDWMSYQMFARRIVVEGRWLDAGEVGPFLMQPLYRYFVGIYHWLFGQSSFVQHMADVWCVLGATILITGFAIKFRLSPVVIFSIGIAYLSTNLIGAYRYHIGKGLVENHAMIFMLLAAWFLYAVREGGTRRIVLATLFGIFGYWMRQDHLGAVAGLAFLMLEPVGGPTGGWKGYWDRFQFQWRKFGVYWGLGICSVLLVSFRNWWMGGDFPIASHPNFSDSFPKGKYYLILTGNEWPHIPSISGFIVTLGVFVALLALIWRPKPLLNFPLSLGVIFVGLLAPYTMLWAGGYAPRFSIHILPLAFLSFAFLANHYLLYLKYPWLTQLLSEKNTS